MLYNSVERGRCLWLVTQTSPTPVWGERGEAELEGSHHLSVATEWFILLKVRPGPAPPPSSAANLNCTWTATSSKTHSVLYFREILWNIIGPFTEFCLDRQGTEEAFTLWVPYTLIIVQVTIASGPNKRCLRKQGIRHQLWFMGSWKKCSTQKITHRPSLLSVV